MFSPCVWAFWKNMCDKVLNLTKNQILKLFNIIDYFNIDGKPQTQPPTIHL